MTKDDALDFIQQDLRRGRGNAIANVILVAGAAALPMALGLGLRDSLDGATSWRVLAPNLAAALFLGAAAYFSLRRTSRGFATVRALLAFATFLAIERAFFPPGGARTTYGSSDEFMTGTAHCFLKGSATTATLGLWLSVFTFRFSTWPSRRWRVLLSLASGVSGAVMLGFHCDSSSWAHVLLGHLAEGLVIGAGIYLALELVFLRGLRARLPKLLAKIRGPRKIG